jgi:hypothetical protein
MFMILNLAITINYNKSKRSNIIIEYIKGVINL